MANEHASEGGEALPGNGEGEPHDGQAEVPTGKVERAGPHWYALFTRSHCEQLVCDQLKAKGLDLFLPKIAVWSRRAGLRRLIPAPMFPGYLFLHHTMDKTSVLEVRKARGLVRILGERWDRLATVPDAEIEAIQRVLRAHLPALPHPYLREGQRVRITGGPLAGVEGILVLSKVQKGLLVLSIELLQRSVAVEVDCTLVVAA
ncbi:MAG: NusG-like protein [Nitrospinae bacterium]|nr:NusG-like protein [Nitrospinota bacterium]